MAKGATAEATVTEMAGHRLTVPRLTEQGFSMNSWVATVDADVPYENVLKSSFWRHVCAKLTQWDKICVRAEDGAYYAELLVVMATKTDAVVREILFLELDAVKVPGMERSYDGYTVKFAGPRKKWQVLRDEDKTVLREGMPTSAAADRWVVEHQKATA